MSYTLPKGRPIDGILEIPLREDAHRNRRALLAVSSICFAVWWTGAFPSTISALGITFSSGDARPLILMGIVFQLYLMLAFCLSAVADYLRWRRRLEDNLTEFAKTPTTLDVAIGAAVDKLGSPSLSPLRRKMRGFLIKLRPEAPDDQKTIVLKDYADGRLSFYRALSRIYWPVVAHHAFLFLLPVLLCFISVGVLASWTPSRPNLSTVTVPSSSHH